MQNNNITLKYSDHATKNNIIISYNNFAQIIKPPSFFIVKFQILKALGSCFLSISYIKKVTYYNLTYQNSF